MATHHVALEYRGQVSSLNHDRLTEMRWAVHAVDDNVADKKQVQAEVAKFAKDLGVNYTLLAGTDAVADTYGGVQFLPTTVYIDRQGRIIERVAGLKGYKEIED